MVRAGGHSRRRPPGLHGLFSLCLVPVAIVDRQMAPETRGLSGEQQRKATAPTGTYSIRLGGHRTDIPPAFAHTHAHPHGLDGRRKKKSDLHAAHLALIWPAASWSMGAWPLTGNEWPQGRAAQTCGLQASRDGRQPGVSTLLAHNGPGWCHDKAMLCSHLASRNFLHASTLTPCSGR